MYVNPNGIRRGIWMGHGDHDIVDSMDPHGDGDVMVGYEVRVIRVCFTSLPVRGMLLEQARGRRMAGRARGGEHKTCPR
jgi:hypothetical protein